MITEDYVSFETAKLLKEKGFDEPIMSVYTSDKKPYIGVILLKCNSDVPNVYPRLTLQMAMKWLRKVHNIHINLDIHWLYFANSKGWMYVIERILENGVEYIDSKGDENDKTFYFTYEQAAEAAIKYCLEKLI